MAFTTGHTQASPYKLDDGRWGAKIKISSENLCSGGPYEGMKLEVTARSGKVWVTEVDEVEMSGSTWFVVSTRKPEPPKPEPVEITKVERDFNNPVTHEGGRPRKWGDEWAVAIPSDDVRRGDHVIVHTRSGKSWEAEVRLIRDERLETGEALTMTERLYPCIHCQRLLVNRKGDWCANCDDPADQRISKMPYERKPAHRSTGYCRKCGAAACIDDLCEDCYEQYGAYTA